MPKFSIEKLNEIRNSKGYTLKELAEMTDIPHSTISKIFAGFNKNPSIEAVQKIANALECGIDDFIEYCKNEKNSIFYFHNLKFDGEFIIYWALKNGFTHAEKKEDIKEKQDTINPQSVDTAALSPDERMIQEAFNDLLKDYLNSNHRRKVERITKAFHFAK